MNPKERTVDYGKSIGCDAQYLKSIGATDEQIKNYVYFHLSMIAPAYRSVYLSAARRGYTAANRDFQHPIYNAYKQRLSMYLAINAACLR